ncbi:MAG: SH3 domain-containing protein [Clostridia bacterium]|nr:SH3 domain-containing protein [Clostridia bacterium]
MKKTMSVLIIIFILCTIFSGCSSTSSSSVADVVDNPSTQNETTLSSAKYEYPTKAEYLENCRKLCSETHSDLKIINIRDVGDEGSFEFELEFVGNNVGKVTIGVPVAGQPNEGRVTEIISIIKMPDVLSSDLESFVMTSTLISAIPHAAMLNYLGETQKTPSELASSFLPKKDREVSGGVVLETKYNNSECKMFFNTSTGQTSMYSGDISLDLFDTTIGKLGVNTQGTQQNPNSKNNSKSQQKTTKSPAQTYSKPSTSSSPSDYIRDRYSLVTPDEIDEVGYTGTVEADGGLNMRYGPSVEYGKIRAIRNRTTISIHGYQNGWYFIYYKDTYGWVSAEFVE